ncbi:hypothetical protein AB0J80_23970 [Actinoplanes sp. NPDC049548]|uniref:hypothetical protein n=1 Tax=Actinoplanes sp. NPDC049548 TaxID=3155152 RepID=UPI00344060DB
MITRILGAAGPTAVVMLAVCFLSGCTADRSCSDHEKERVAVLGQLPILGAKPASTQ